MTVMFFGDLTESLWLKQWGCRARALWCSRAVCTLSCYITMIAQLSVYPEWYQNISMAADLLSTKITFLFFRLSRGRECRDCGSEVKLGGTCHVYRQSHNVSQTGETEIGSDEVNTFLSSRLAFGPQMHI